MGSGDKYMMEFKKRIESLNDNREYKVFLTAEEETQKTNNTFKEIGKREEAAIIAKNLLSMKMTLEDISKATGLTLEEIKKLEK